MSRETVRKATHEDTGHLKDLYIDAFPEEEGEVVGELAVALTGLDDGSDAISLVLEADRQIIAHVSFSRVVCKEEPSIIAYCLAPLAVKRSLHKSGYGTNIVQHGLDLLREKKSDVVLVYGDPKYYGRFGFDAKIGKQFLVPYELEYDFGWQGLFLSKLTVSTPQHCAFVSALSDQKFW